MPRTRQNLHCYDPPAPAPDLETATVEQLTEVLSNLPLGLSMYGPDERLIVCNSQYIRTYAVDPAIVKPGARYIDVLAHSIERGNQSGMSAPEYYAKRMRENRDPQLAISHSLLWNGRTMQVTNRPLPNGGWLSLHEDVTDKLEAHRRIAHLANHDALTSLPNRNTFHARMSDILAGIGETGSAAVLFMDLDRFKQVNDTLGHMVGDQLLVDVADRLRRTLRRNDVVVRLGGDEFVVLQDNARQPHAALLARRLIAAMRNPFSVEGHRVEVGLSIGIALAPADGATSDVLLRHADLALYRAKSRGGSSYCFHQADLDDDAQIPPCVSPAIGAAADRAPIDTKRGRKATFRGENT